MEKVYLVEHREIGEGSRAIGVFSTLEGAREAVLKQFSNKNYSVSGPAPERWLEIYNLPSYSISIREINFNELKEYYYDPSSDEESL